MATAIPSVYSNWNHHFDGLTFSSQDFYKAVEEAVMLRKMPDVKISKVNLSQGGLFSADREYLRITRKDDVFDICAAPFGTGFFVSWWLGSRNKSLLQRFVPGILTASNKTYFQLDTQNMFKGCVRNCVNECIAKIVNQQGLRMPSDATMAAGN